MKAVILAAGVGSRLAPLTDDRPKCLVEVAGRSMLFRQLDQLAAAGIGDSDVVIVGGYRVGALGAALAAGGHERCTVVVNNRFEPWNNFWSLYVAEPAVRGHDLIQLDGDVVFDDAVVARVMAAEGDALLAVDCRPDLDDETMKVEVDDTGRVTAIGKQLAPAGCAGEYVGISRLSAAVAAQVFPELVVSRDTGHYHEYYEHSYQRLIERGAVRFGIVDVHGCRVMEIDDLADRDRAEALLSGAGPG